MVTRYIDPTTDFGFKRLFGREDSRELLKAFLHAMLALPHPIRDLTYLPTAQIPDLPDDRVSIYDVYCTDEAGRRFIVEMQRNWQLHFKERTLYYVTFPITQQVEKGRWDYELLPIYCLSILNFALDAVPDYLRSVQLCDIQTGGVFYDKLTFVFVELPKFQKMPAELQTDAEKWTYLLQRLPELQDIPAELAQTPYQEVFGVAEEATLSPEERWAYEASLKRARDDWATVQSALQRGHAEGRAEGRAEGALAAKQAVAQEMLARGLDIALIAELTGLAVAEIASLRENLTE